MKVTWSGIGPVNGTGKLGGTVFQNGRFGSIARRWVKPVNVVAPNFNGNFQRVNFSQITAAWRGLTPTERASWTPIGPGGLSGYNLFVSANLNYYRSQGIYITTYSPPGPAEVYTTANIQFNHATGLCKIDITVVSSVAGQGFLFYVANNLSKGVQSVRKSLFRLVYEDFPPNGVNHESFDARINGVPLIMGSQCFLKLTPFDLSTGFTLVPTIYSALVT